VKLGRAAYWAGALFAPLALILWLLFLSVATDFVRRYAILPMAVATVAIPALLIARLPARQAFVRGAFKTAWLTLVLVILLLFLVSLRFPVYPPLG
jgi:hypothetical protein